MSAVAIVQRLSKALEVPLVFLNTIGMIAAGITMLVVGYWKLVLLGFLIGWISCYLVAFVIAPTLIAAPALVHVATNRKYGLLWVILAVCNLYHAIWITIWCAAIIYLFAGFAHSVSTFVLLLVWTYGISTAPLTWAAKHEDEGLTAFIFAFFAQISYLLLFVYALFGQSNFIAMIAIVFLVMLAAALVATKVALELISVDNT